ncbi:tail length tape-measure protein 1 [Pseudoalteromonas phage H103]|uniref:tail length tape measure protein n=1 Tax=Pseudoalteromonas phage H103 TaxID=1636200 RepID=UPI0006BC27C1|nr:tail length tape measure protein [Pseudoalteromonas phage H103]AKA61191.1 tail length tape-measure protein 1 [Pseudoalteromonas phage H103]
MAENLGSIRYDVEVGTSGMLKAEKVVETSTKNVEKDLQRVESASTKAYSTIAASSKKSAAAINTQMTQVAKSTKGASFQAANFSYQIQDIAVQAQMGTSPLVIFAQQFPQMAVGMGAAAGAIGAAVAILGALGTAVIDTSTSMDRLQKAIEKVQAVITIGAGGVANYSEEMQKLNTISEALTRIKLQNALAEQATALKEVSGAMRDAWEEAGTFYDQTSSGVVGEIIKDRDLKKLDDLAEKYNAGTISAEEFNEKAGDIRKAIRGVNLIDKGIKNLGYTSKEAQEQGLQQLIDGLKLMSTSAAQNTKAGRELSSNITELVIKYKEGKLTLDALRESLDGTTDSFDKNAGTIKNLTNEFVLNAVRLSEGERAAFKFGLQLQGLDSDQIKAQLSLYDYNKELEKTKEEAEASANAIKSVNDELDSFFDKESSDSTKKDEQRKATLTTQVQSVGLTPLEEVKARYKKEQELLDEHKRIINDKEIDYVARSIELERQKQEAIQGLQSNTSEFMENAFGNLDTQIAGTLGSIALGAQDGEEAFRSLANTILTQVVGALIQEQVTSALVSAGFIAQKGAETAAVVGGIGAQAAAATAATATTTAATVASGVAITAAMAPAAAATSIATAGAAPAAASGITLSTIGLIIGGLVGATALAGGREFGGPVSAGSMYRVGEKGKPEFYKDNLGNLSMIPGENGEVIPANKMGGNSGGMTVQVNNYTPYQVFVTQDQATNIAKVEIGNEASKLQKGRGNMYNAMKSGGNYKNDAKR